MTEIKYALEDLEKVSNMPGDKMVRNDNDIFIRRTAENAIELLKEQEADIIAMSRFLESHGWDSDSICGKLS